MTISNGQRALAASSIILIVDDVPGNLEILGSLLSEAGFEISVATNGMQALTAAVKAPPALILMDVSMPEMDGYSACERLKANPLTADIPIIFLTAHSGESEIVRGFEAGGVDYITKPFKSAELMARILTHLELRQSRERIRHQNDALMEINEKLARSEEGLLLANSMKDKFFSILAHDLKNPVTLFYQVSTLLLEKDMLDEESSLRYLRSLHDAASNLRNLLDNLLTWARSQAGRIDFEPSPQRIAPLAREVLSLLAPGARQKGISVTMEIADDTAATFDENMVGTVLRNLISNAIKFTSEGGAVTLAVEKRGDFLALSVTDTGIGMTVADLGKLFRIDVHQSTIGTGREKGTGLGLILCKEFVEKHGGTIEVQSEPGRGSIFTFTLPC
ncbi:MAG: hybrid sensor histidine kinase/response regulator [Candidatus Eremiobacteraeota bacterium]|nr:hybrid sensor histidine kinase/response regulator [Candidatus Eremiobacteraeota bacterium]